MIIWVIFFAIFVPGIVALIQIYMAEVDTDGAGKLKVIIPAIVLVISIVIIGLTIANSSLGQHIESFKAHKQVIESSINNENLNGLERFELMKLAAEHNANIAKIQFAMKLWYNVGHSPTLINELMNLQPINVSGEVLQLINTEGNL